MRIAFLTHEPFYPPSGGGSAEAVYLVRELVARNHEVHLFGPPVPEPEWVEREFGIIIHPFQNWEMGRYTPLRNLKYLLYPFFLERLVMTAAARVKFDLVLSQHAISAVAAGRLKRRLGIPVVMNFLDFLTGFMESWPFWLMPPPVLAVLKRYELSIPCRFQADAVLTVSDTLADLFAQAGFPSQRLLPIYYGYDPKLFVLSDDAMAARSDTPATIVMHGSFDHHHLGGIAFDAMARVHAVRPDAIFKFVGRQTPAVNALMRRVHQALPGLKAECTGFVPYGEVASLVGRATVGMVPYRESSGTHCAFVAKTVEYLALGLPVVSTPLKSATRYFRNEPLVRFSGFDGASLGDRVLSWLGETPKSRAALGRMAAGRGAEKLDWKVICRKAADSIEATHDQRK